MRAHTCTIVRSRLSTPLALASALGPVRVSQSKVEGISPCEVYKSMEERYVHTPGRDI